MTALDVAGWLEGARERAIHRFWLSIPEPGGLTIDGQAIPGHVLAAFAGAAESFLLGTSAEQSQELWRASWVVADEKGPDQRIWDVDYHGVPLDDPVVPFRPEISASAHRLIVALEKIERFARGQQLTTWAGLFADARILGEAEHPQPPSPPDMLPAVGFPAAARQLLAMATRAWVFGGMGSWNDLAFADQEEEDEYNLLSAELHSSVVGAFVAAVNADLED